MKYDFDEQGRAWSGGGHKITEYQKKQRGKVIYKWFRTDKCLWEEKIKWWWRFHYYRYSIWNDGKVDVHYRLWKYPRPVYIKGANENKPIAANGKK